jgi:hypothetical protein
LNTHFQRASGTAELLLAASFQQNQRDGERVPLLLSHCTDAPGMFS